MQLKTPDGRVVFEYLTKKPDNIGLTSPSAACFHPVNTPSGQCITSIAPDDHPHHRGIFFGWHDSAFYEPQVRPNPSPTSSMRAATVRRADFWGWGVFAPRDGRLVQNREIKLLNADAAHAELAIHNDLLVENRKMGEENDTVTVTERDGVFVLDLAYTIAPTVEYRLNQNAFGGFDVQCRKDGDSYYSDRGGKSYASRRAVRLPGARLAERTLVRLHDSTIRQRQDPRRCRNGSPEEPAYAVAQFAHPLDAQPLDHGGWPGRHQARKPADTSLSRRRS